MSPDANHVSLASLLTDYGALGDGDNLAAHVEEAVPEIDVSPDESGFEQLPQSSTSALEDAYTRGFEEGQREAETRLIHELGEQAAAAEKKLEEARKAWVTETGEVLSMRLDTALQDMHHVLADHFAQVLLPIVEDAVKQEAVRKIAGAIRATVASDWNGPLQVEGPADLLTALKHSLGETAPVLDCQETSGAEVTVKVNDTTLKTQLTAWGETVTRILS